MRSVERTSLLTCYDVLKILFNIISLCFFFNLQYRDAFIQDYKVGLLPYLMRHKINEATLPDTITQLTERRNKKQKA